MLFLEVFGGMLFILDHFVKVLQLGAVELTNFLELLFNVHMFEGRQVTVQVLGDAFASWLQLRVPFYPIVVLRERKPIHHQVILHSHSACVLYLLSLVQQFNNRMQTFKEISYQNYIVTHI